MPGHDSLSASLPVAGFQAAQAEVPELVVISGYRSSEYNRLRRKQSRQVGEKSFHLQGKAIDLRIEGVTITALHDYIKGLKAGGVGFYPDSQFVHMDVGPIRTWQGD